MIRKLLKASALCALLALSGATRAEDIDLFVGRTPLPGEVPNVLIMVDNTANWNTAFANEMSALSAVISALPVDKFRVGLMMYTETGSGNSGTDGGYVRSAIRPMDAAGKAKLIAQIAAFTVGGDKSNGGKMGMGFAEAYRYFSAGAPIAGNNKKKTDYTGNIEGTAADIAIMALGNNALSSKTATVYNNPILVNCVKNYIIYMSNGAVQDNSADTTTATGYLTGHGGTSTQVPLSPSGSQSNVADEWARFMKASPLNITTYTVDIDKITTGQGPGFSALLKSIASVSQGKYFDVSSASGGGSAGQIGIALTKIFSEIQSVNSVFASVSLPVSVNTQGTYLNQVFIGMFRPDSDAFPRWNGNLKQYKLGQVGSDIVLQDANSARAISAQTGFIGECARSFWTPSVADTYWTFAPQGTCLTIAGANDSNYPDGNVVEKGGQGYVRRANTTRTLKTCDNASCTAMIDFNTTNVTQAALGAASTAEHTALVNWAKGIDVNDENINANTTTEMRPSVHGDVVHSRPVAINYGTDASPQIVVYYGANDGLLRAVNGNRSTAHNGFAAGAEIWAFATPEFIPKIKRIRDNAIPVSFPGQAPTTPAAQAKDYGVDGPMALRAVRDTTTGSLTSATLYASLRRGGREIYAFDVTAPTAPSLKWRIGCPNLTNDTGCTTGLTGMGQTWSTPQFIKASGSTGVPLMIVAGGYDNCEDADANTCTTSAKGAKIYVFNANTGALLQTMSTDRPIIADITVLTDTAGNATYAYAVDLGGNVYRITINAFAAGSFTNTKIASLGCSTAATCASNRKFMFPADVVVEGGKNLIMLGSGDREKPLSTYTATSTVTNMFFQIKDDPTDSTWLTSQFATCSANLMCLSSLIDVNSTPSPTQLQLDAAKGWKKSLAATEQVVTSSVTLYGTTTFSSHQPAVSSAATCGSSLGTATVYNIRYASATGTAETISGGGLPPSPVAGRVLLDDGTTATFVIGSVASSPIESAVRTSSQTSGIRPKGRVYWHVQK